MGTGNGHVLYIGTTGGLYIGEPGARGYTTRLLGFQGLGHFRTPVVVDGHDPSRLYAGTIRGGMFRSRDGGESWEEINAGLAYKTVWSIVQDPRTGHLYVGTSPACVFISTDGGDTWKDCEELETLPTTKDWTGPVPPHVSRMKGLAVSGDTPSIYGAIEEGWAVRSLDGGESWEQIAEGLDHDGHWIAALPGEPDTVVASTGKGVFRSIDRGSHWDQASEGLEHRRYTTAPLIGHPARSGFLVTAVSAVGPGRWTRENPDAALARTDDGGRSWRTLTEGLPQPISAIPRGLAVAADDPDLCAVGMTDGSVWISEDGGGSFRQALDGLPPVRSLALAQR